MGSIPRDSNLEGHRACELAFLTCSQVMLVLLALRPHSEKHFLPRLAGVPSGNEPRMLTVGSNSFLTLSPSLCDVPIPLSLFLGIIFLVNQLYSNSRLNVCCSGKARVRLRQRHRADKQLEAPYQDSCFCRSAGCCSWLEGPETFQRCSPLPVPHQMTGSGQRQMH